MIKCRTLVLMLLMLSGGALADDFVGQASVVDGDTLDIHGTRIRLWGVDAPESSQLCRGADSNLYRCGAKAANDLDSFIARRPVNCTPVAGGQYDRICASCAKQSLSPPHCAKGIGWLLLLVTCRLQVMRSKSTADSRPNLRPGMVPRRAPKS